MQSFFNKAEHNHLHLNPYLMFSRRLNTYLNKPAAFSLNLADINSNTIFLVYNVNVYTISHNITEAPLKILKYNQ